MKNYYGKILAIILASSVIVCSSHMVSFADELRIGISRNGIFEKDAISPDDVKLVDGNSANDSMVKAKIEEDGKESVSENGIGDNGDIGIDEVVEEAVSADSSNQKENDLIVEPEIFSESEEASGTTLNDAVQWVRDRANEHWEINDGSGWTQCTEFVWAYYEYLLGRHVSGHAYQYLTDTYGACPYNVGWSRPDVSTVRPGDIVIWDRYAKFRADGTDYCLEYGHIGVVVSVDGNTMVTAEANAGEARGACGYKYNREVSCISGLIRPNLQTDHAPEGTLDIISGENGELWVRGWAFDRDNLNRNLDIHIWVDDAEPIGAGVANTFRNDVNNVHGCGNYHGFDFKLETGLTGSHLIRVYAIGVDSNGNNNGNNSLVGNGSQNVTFYGSVGEEMSSGAGRTIPDGDYVIKSLQNPAFQVDIAGANVPSSNMDNIALWNTDESRVQDVFTVKYMNNGFYSIMQKDTNMAVEVYGANKAIKANVNMYEANGSVAQQWSISSEVFEGNRDAYRIKARCNGYSLDVENGNVGPGTNIQMFATKNEARQGWVFKRYITPEEKNLKDNWICEIDDVNRTFTLISYNGTDSYVVVPAKIKVNDLDYSTILRGTGSYYEHTFPEGVQEVVFEDGVKAASNMKYLFTNNDSLMDIDLSGLDTGDVADMSLMFSGCRNLRKLVISGNDTGNVEDFTGMFMNCQSLETIDLSDFSVSHGADISSMFSGCTSLKTIYTKENEDWSGFATGSSTFSECTSLEGGIRYDASKTSKDYAKVSGGYFTAKSSGNSDIPPANVLLEDWTTNVNDEDKTITLISYTGKDTAIVVPSEVEDGDVNYSVIIQGTNDINKHTFPSETQSITIQNGVKAGKDISYLFSENEQLTTIDITGLDTSNVSNMTGLFNGCKKLEKLDLSNFNTKKTTCYNIMFENCDNLEELDLSGFDFSNASSMMGMFIACDKLKTIDMSSFEMISPVEISGMFSGCTSLRTIYTGANADWSELAVGTTPFSSCISLSGAISYDPNDPYCADKKYAKVSGGYFTSKTSETPVNPPTPNPPVDPDRPVVPEDPNKLLHTVTYMNGNMMFMVQTVGDGELAVKPLDNPTKEGYSFAGWISGGELWNFTTPVTYNLVLTAKFIRDTISENKSSGSGMDPIPYLTGDNKIYLVVGQTYTLGKKGFISNNKRVATVDSKKGKITAKAAGEGEAVISDGTEKYYVIVQKPVFSAEYKKSDVMIGESRVLKLSGIDNSYSDYYPISWQSSNAKIATVNDGVVTGIAKGKVKIHAYVGGKKYTSSVNVNDMYTMPKKLSADSAIEINPLHTVQLKYDSKVFSLKNATWSGLSDNALMEITNKQGRLIGYRNKVVEINKTGKVKAIGTGTTTIDGKDINNRVVTLKISVKPVSTKGAVYLNINKTDTIKFPKVDNSKAKWLLDDREVTDNGVIRIDGRGKIKGLGVGNTKVTCAYEGFTFESFVYVENPDIATDQKMTRNGNKLELKVPANGVYIIKLKDVYQTPLWNSKNRNIALVDENGTIYARKSGNTIISTIINGKTAKIYVKVLD